MNATKAYQGPGAA